MNEAMVCNSKNVPAYLFNIQVQSYIAYIIMISMCVFLNLNKYYLIYINKLDVKKRHKNHLSLYILF